MGLPSVRMDLYGLSLYRAVRADPVLDAVERFAAAVAAMEARASPEGKPAVEGLPAAAEAWAGLAGALHAEGEESLHGRLARLAAEDDNPFTRAAERTAYGLLPAGLTAAAGADLERLRRIAAWDVRGAGEFLAGRMEAAGYGEAAASLRAEAAALARPERPADDVDFNVAAVAARIRAGGAGLFSRHGAFLWVGAAELAPLRPIRYPDRISLEELSGYEEQRAVVIANTLRFLEGRGANNLLLYGDRGTGKSATVKAACNAYAERGLRLVEVRKKDLGGFSDILDALAGRALRFVVFIDDLSFEETDDAFTGLKALLEGGAERRPDNVVVYATSNRRHLVKERFADRPTTAAAALAAETGDVRAFDSMQEQLSLADRFGVTVVFSAPSQDEYLRIAEFLAEREGLLDGEEETDQKRRLFRENALRWERWFNGRSPRTARQFVDWAVGGAGFPWEQS